MYDSKLTDFDIVDATPYKKDPMKELADAVRAEGLTFCFYYSIPDWHDPNFPAKYSHATNGVPRQPEGRCRHREVQRVHEGPGQASC